ncbi:ribosomal protein S18-alanine N-acetyltransferase [Brevundimonas balnearis]|uniref:[Ribosomal protein bS18]-alanine N-acetyltransferase n=1 Tax=Brevundimonas balnearis TaxID=1572858 RepID=A0ABV6R378_9CAUL
MTELAVALARLHARAFADPWPEDAFAQLLAQPTTRVHAAPHGFILTRLTVDEAEILTLAVDPERRRAGIGRGLIDEAAAALAAEGATRLFLEVAVDNVAARALYAATGFAEAGVRRGYYARPGGAIDALVLSRELKLP